MELISGRNVGKTLIPHQYANNWISATDPETGRSNIIVYPNQVQLHPADRALFAGADPEHPDHGGHGTFWTDWHLNDDGTFSRREAAAPRQRRRRPR